MKCVSSTTCSLCSVIKDLSKQRDKNAGTANKLSSTWSKPCGGFKEPYPCLSRQNLVLDFPGIAFFCTDSDELLSIFVFSSHRLLKTIN